MSNENQEVRVESDGQQVWIKLPGLPSDLLVSKNDASWIGAIIQMATRCSGEFTMRFKLEEPT